MIFALSSLIFFPYNFERSGFDIFGISDLRPSVQVERAMRSSPMFP
jgi:hypothetical protein